MNVPAKAALFSSESQTWLTPQPVLDRVLDFEPRGIELDPFGNVDSIMRARRQYLIEQGEDAFALPWSDVGLNWANPEFADAERAAARCVAEAQRGCEILLLLPNRSDTAAYQDYLLPNAAARCLWRGRLKFGAGRAPSRQGALFGGEPAKLNDGENSSTFATCISYFGTRPHRFAQAFKPAGHCVVPR